MPLPFDKIKQILEGMTSDYKLKLIKAYGDFAKLKSFCEAKGYIKSLPNLQGIKVLKKTAEVKELKEIIDFLKPGHFKWEDK